MSDSIFSPSWYRVADLKPRLRNHARLHRHEYRGRLWYVLHDRVSGRTHRFSPSAYRFIGLMDGHRSVQALWDELNRSEGSDAPSQHHLIQLLGQLHAADLLICDVSPDSSELLRRHDRFRMAALKQRVWTPLAIRLPLLDPDRFLTKTLPFVRFVFSRYGALVWLATICAAVVLAASNWPALTEDIVDRALSFQNVALLWFVYPLVKAVHEAMHGYATKIHGGEVHEMGVMFLVLVPVPYVDASAAWAFRDKRRRMLVGAIGIMAELFLGAIALFVWLSVEPGIVRAIAYNVMLISGVSTLLFNGNPLLRFDGYYVLSDALEIPNLATRSNQYLGYLVRRYLFGASQARSPADTAGEARWFALYGTAAFAYRVFILSVIVLYVGSRFFVVGVVLALWALMTQVAVPVVKNIRFVLQSPELTDNRGRAIRVTAGAIAGALILLLAVPVPSWTRAQGVVWPPERSQLRAAAAGTVREILVADGTLVEQGEPLILTEDAELEARVRVLESQQQEFERQLALARTIDQVQTDIAREELTAVSASLERARERLKALTIRSPRSGTLIVPRSRDLEGRYVRQGEMLAFVVDDADRLSVRAVIDQDHIGRVRDNVRRVDVFQRRWSARAFAAELVRAVPGGTEVLPTAALGSAAGGDIPVDPRDDEGRTALEPVFEFEVTMPPEAEQRFIGHRMYVRFDHGYEPAGWQLYRVIRQLLLSRFDV